MTFQIKESVIINRGRGPEISGTRITVYDVMDYYTTGWHRDEIAALFRLSSRDIEAATDYIEANKEEVQREYQKILDRHHNYKYPPWVQKVVDECRGKAEQRLREIRARRAQENQDANDHG